MLEETGNQDATLFGATSALPSGVRATNDKRRPEDQLSQASNRSTPSPPLPSPPPPPRARAGVSSAPSTVSPTPQRERHLIPQPLATWKDWLTWRVTSTHSTILSHSEARPIPKLLYYSSSLLINVVHMPWRSVRGLRVVTLYRGICGCVARCWLSDCPQTPAPRKLSGECCANLGTSPVLRRVTPPPHASALSSGNVFNLSLMWLTATVWPLLVNSCRASRLAHARMRNAC